MGSPLQKLLHALRSPFRVFSRRKNPDATPSRLKLTQEQVDAIKKKRVEPIDTAHGEKRDKPLVNVSVQGLDLSGTDWGEEDFSKCDLRGANLSGCKFSGADFRDAELWNADLRDSDLNGSLNLLPAQLAATDLTGAKLPEDLAEFGALETVEAMSVSSSKVFFTLLLTAAYVLITEATLRDVQLITDTQPIKLPIVEVPIRVTFFLVTAPLLLLCLYIYFHLYLQRLWETMAQLPARFPDGRRLDERTHPWLMNDLARVHIPLLRANSPPLSKLQSLLSMSVGYALVPLIICAMWFRCTGLQNWKLMGFHIVIFGLSVACAANFTRLIHVALAKKNPESKLTTRLADICGVGFGYPLGIAAALTLTILSIGVTEAGEGTGVFVNDFELFEPSSKLSPIWKGEAKDHQYWPPRHPLPRWIVQPSVALSALFPMHDRTWVQAEDLSNKPTSWTGLPKKQDEELGQVHRVQLEGNLARLQAGWSFCAKDFFWHTNISWSDFSNADLRGITFLQVTACKAKFENARLADGDEPSFEKNGKADMDATHSATIYGGLFKAAKFGGAVLTSIQASAVDFSDSDFTGAHGRAANFGWSVLDGAFLVSSDFRQAIFTCASLEGATLTNANLEGAKFMGADLKGAYLEDADLKGADLRRANLQGVRVPVSELVGLLRKAKTIYHAEVDSEVHAALAIELEMLPQDELYRVYVIERSDPKRWWQIWR